MRLTPSQTAMLIMSGKEYPRFPRGSLEERIKRGHELLLRCSDMDFKGDLIAWHHHLLENDLGGYKWSSGHLSVKSEIDKVVNDLNWQRAIENVFGSSE